ncbi:MAG: aminopeptidase N [Synechococcaceae cyanobacterium]|nr:aminopeptidase N [Synechococcaceae cyanobacterium]
MDPGRRGIGPCLPPFLGLADLEWPAPVRLSDYRPSPWRLLRTDLQVCLHNDHTTVAASLAVEPDPLGWEAWQAESCSSRTAVPSLDLRGVDLETLSLAIDGEPLAETDLLRGDEQLRLLAPPPRPFLFQSTVRIDPHRNTSLEGLYVSGGLFTTQCEAEGFRRITWHPDRPDLLSRFRVRLEADQERCPVLLSNGNCIDKGSLPEAGAGRRHYALWDDPYPKPSYLFALVAGQLEEVRQSFSTASGRTVQLRLWVEHGDAAYTAHALASLQRAMRWDEQVYGLEYDLDEYNIVAVRHFNMGAMENKSLNIFNSKLVLADSATATDDELERIESVIAHEYFHNWTGNRITCRDWFQLSLKEGLTVFRDQCFSADLHGRAQVRIPTVALLRNTQFREDAGPTAHPIQPDDYQAIDNFYTTTIYEKGSEVIRCLHTLLGEETFRRGIGLYIQRHDGTAATCDDFLEALRDAAEADWAATGRDAHPPFDFSAFRRWYHQAGTPHVHVQRHWDANGVLELTLRQHTPPTPGQPIKHPLVLPLALGAIGQDGQALTLRLEGESTAEAQAVQLPPDGWGQRTRLLILDQEERHLRFVGLPCRSQPPALSLLRGFSAPVRLEIGRPPAELVHLLRWDSDAFARWDAAQVLLSQAVLARASGAPEQRLEEELIDAYAAILSDPTLSQASRGLLMELPGLAELEEASLAPPDPPALHAARLALLRRLGEALAAPLDAALDDCIPGWSEPWPAGQGDRRLTAMIWSWRVAAHDRAAIAAARAAVDSTSMTLARAGLRALQPWPLPERHAALAAFHDRWQERPVILDSWFALEASAPFADGLERVERLLAHPRFDPMAPNSVRAVLGGLVGNAPVFHAADGRGYRFLAERIAELDQRNPITASRLVKAFSRWRSYAPERAAQMAEALGRLRAAPLSTNSRELVEQCLAD